MSQIETNSKLQLYLCSKTNQTRSIVVTKHSTVSILDKLYKLPNKYFYCGQILDKRNNFVNQGVKNEDFIFVLNESENIGSKAEMQHLVKIARENHQDSSAVYRAKVTANNELRMEASRLNDIRLMKKEMKGRPLKINAFIDCTKKESKDFQLTEAPNLSSPSSTPLPAFW